MRYYNGLKVNLSWEELSLLQDLAMPSLQLIKIKIWIWPVGLFSLCLLIFDFCNQSHRAHCMCRFPHIADYILLFQKEYVWQWPVIYQWKFFAAFPQGTLHWDAINTDSRAKCTIEKRYLACFQSDADWASTRHDGGWQSVQYVHRTDLHLTI